MKVFTLPPASGAKISMGLEGNCTGHELLAVTENGQEVERREPGLCLDEVWRVTSDLMGEDVIRLTYVPV